MQFADTHTHLYLEPFNSDLDAVIGRAATAGVSFLFLPNIDSHSMDSLFGVCRRHPEHCFAMMGLHPTSVQDNFREELKKVEEQLQNPPVSFYAIGEIGIDLYRDKSHRVQQEEAFLFQFELAKNYTLPVVIHTRNSMELAIRLIESNYSPDMKGIFHCFSGNIRQAERAVELGFKLGIGGVVTFKNSGLKQVVKAVPLEHLLLETDAPYLAPVPYRGQRNEPAYIPLIAATVAEIKCISLEAVAEVTTREAKRVFKVDELMS